MKNTTMENNSQEKLLLLIFLQRLIQLCTMYINQILEERKRDKNIQLPKHDTNQIFTNHIQLTIYRLITASITAKINRISHNFTRWRTSSNSTFDLAMNLQMRRASIICFQWFAFSTDFHSQSLNKSKSCHNLFNELKYLVTESSLYRISPSFRVNS